VRRMFRASNKIVTQPNFPYYSTVDQIYNAEWAISKLARLELLRASIHALWPNGHPTKLFQVVGTGGKGSTARFLELGFSCAGKAGALMSPHLFDYRERFSINGEFASQEDVAWAWEERVKPHCLQVALRNHHHAHTFHEVSILIALALFEKHGVSWAAMEASIGYDQTRALDAVAVALTNVGSDHAHLLGQEQWQRVLDKSGSARPGIPFFTSEQDPANLEIIKAVCAEAGAPLRIIEPTEVSDLAGRLADWHVGTADADALVHAAYQKWNAALSLAIVRHFCPEIDERQILAQFDRARLPGRLWKVEEGVYADIAHNAEKMKALAGALVERFGNRGKIVVIGLSGPRTPPKVFAALSKMAKAIIITGASFKGQDPDKVRDEITGVVGDTPALVVHDPQQALAAAKSMRQEQDVVILTGSTYMIEQALNPDPYLRSLNSSFGWRTAVDLEAHGTVDIKLPKPPPPLR
jgi:dihydrofolate synthase/folylpolyglutamate synthase